MKMQFKRPGLIKKLKYCDSDEMQMVCCLNTEFANESLFCYKLCECGYWVKGIIITEFILFLESRWIGRYL